MDTLTFSLVLLAAATHALWNVWLKQSENRLITLATMSLGWGVVGLVALPFVAVPVPAAWPYLIASVLIHIVYALVLVASYRLGDLSVAYPVARGTGPLLVTLVAVGFLGERIGIPGLIAIGLIIGGVLLLGARGQAERYNWQALLVSLCAGALIGSYTLVDGLGGRAGDPHSYAIWLFLLQGFAIAPIALWLNRTGFRDLAASNWPKDIAGGVISVGAYWIAIWAMSNAPLPLVAAVRESSVAFAALFGGLMLKERVNWLAVTLILAGVIAVRLTAGQ